jgi:hypothetical protein
VTLGGEETRVSPFALLSITVAVFKNIKIWALGFYYFIYSL